jgi:aldehyde dehydrogenase (NAD+)
LLPLIGVIASDNTAIIKLHVTASHYANVIENIFPIYFQPNHYHVINGGRNVTKGLLERRFAHVCYAGGLAGGVRVMHYASENLTPLTLELGGKSPVVVTSKADIALAAKLIAWGKFTSAGQVCVAPDYALVQYEVLPEFIGMLKLVSCETGSSISFRLTFGPRQLMQ